MAQHDYDLVDAPPLTVRTELNSILSAILTTNSGPLPPTETYKGELWFNNDPANTVGVLQLRNSDGTAWGGIPVDVEFLPLSGGTVGALTVQGTFSNPEYDKLRVNRIGNAAPGSAETGMLWYDTSVSPAVLRVYTKGGTWVNAVDMATPTFLDALTITASGSGNAHIILQSQGVQRYIYNEHGNDRTNFWTPGSGLAATFQDDGNAYFAAIGYVYNALAAKQPALGFTPIRQTGGNKIIIGYSTPHLWVDNVDQGTILFGAATPQYFNRADVGALTYAHPGAAVAGNGTVSGSTMTYVPDNASVGVGTWRNLQGTMTATQTGIFQRIA